jgi:hypothetical protein
MGFSLKNLFKGAAIAATGFVASKYLGPVGRQTCKVELQ